MSDEVKVDEGLEFEARHPGHGWAGEPVPVLPKETRPASGSGL